MAELTYDPTPADQQEFSAEEQDSLRVGQELAEANDQMLAGKFTSAEELEKAYLELQQKLGQGESEEQVQEEVEELESSPLSDALSYYAENGKLTDELAQSLDDVSYEEIFEAFQNQAVQVEDLSEQEISAIKNYVGGEDSYQALMGWAGETLDPSYVEAFDDLVQNGSARSIQLAVRGLMAEYENQNGYEGRMLTGKAVDNTPDVFRSQAEVVDAMSDPRYDRDPAYRQDIFNKLERSDLNF